MTAAEGHDGRSQVDSPTTGLLVRVPLAGRRCADHQPAADPVVRVTVDELDDTYLGTRLLVTDGTTVLAGGLSDLEHRTVIARTGVVRVTDLYLGGQCITAAGAVVVLTDPTPTALDALADS